MTSSFVGSVSEASLKLVSTHPKYGMSVPFAAVRVNSLEESRISETSRSFVVGRYSYLYRSSMMDTWEPVTHRV